MSDLISRRAAIEALGKRPRVYTGSKYEIGQRNQYDMDKLAIETVLSAEPERKKGKWIPENTRDKSWIFCCSECGRMAYYPQNHHNDGTKKCGYALCPNCGADMREEE